MNMAPVAFLVSCNWVSFLDRDGRHKNYISLIVIIKKIIHCHIPACSHSH